MNRKLIASVGIASLILLSTPIAAQAATESVTDAPPTPVIVDQASTTQTFTVDTAGEIESVEISVDFSIHDGETCDLAIVDEGFSYPNELGMTLTSPDGTSVVLMSDWADGTLPTTYMDQVEPVRVTVDFTDSASDPVGSSTSFAPVSGSFQPAQPLSAFQGLEAAGMWSLEFRDVEDEDVKCYYGATLTIHTVEDAAPVIPVDDPTPPSKIETAAE